MILTPGCYGFDTLDTGNRVETGSREITASLIDGFADVSGDRYAIHMNDAAAQARGFAGRVAHGLLILSVIDGLKNTAPARIDALASLGWTWGFISPVFVNDIIRATFTATDKRRTSSGRRGIIHFEVIVKNQEDSIVQSGENRLIFDLQNKPLP